ncbi:MAG: iron-containing alcohol dehydrogenase, partial [Dongiaceae bacterium]
MTIASFSLPPNTRVAFGTDRAQKLGDDVAAIAGPGATVLIVADPGLPQLAERVDDILKKAGCKTGLFTEVRSDPLGSQVDAAAARARSLDAVVVVGIGGGSTMDVSKFAAAIAR